MRRKGFWRRGLAGVLTVSLLQSALYPGLTVSASGMPSGDNILQEGQLLTEGEDTAVYSTEMDSQELNDAEKSGNQSQNQSTVDQSQENPDGQTGNQTSIGDQTANQIGDQTENTGGTAGSGQEEQPVEQNIYAEGKIQIYNEAQLAAIGSGNQAYTGDETKDSFGTGQAIVDENGAPVTYGLDKAYVLMNDIPLDSQNMWQLPQDFTGSFSSADGKTADETSALYDAQADTIYIYHPYQLMLMAMQGEDVSEQPVMSEDYDAAHFGMGQMIYPNGEENGNLTYSRDHQYSLSRYFSAEMPEMLASQIQEQAEVSDDQLGGRDYLGQVYTEIEGENYILIGNEYQLREIGSGEQVTPMLYVKTVVSGPFGLGKTTTYVPYYPGDADYNVRKGTALGEKTSTEEDFLYFSTEDGKASNELFHIEYDKEGLLGTLLGPLGNLLEDVLGGLLGGLLGIIGGTLGEILGGAEKDIVIVDKALTETNAASFQSITSPPSVFKNMKYTSDANYIIFRNIDLDSNMDDVAFGNGNGKTSADDPWEPIMLSGNMLGRKNMQENVPVTISNVVVQQGDEINIQKTTGVGFFGTIAGQQDDGLVGTSTNATVVKDINLKTVQVNSTATTTKDVNQSLIGALLEGVGGLVGGVFGALDTILGTFIPGLGLNIGEALEELLSRQTDAADTYATGSFAGRVTGYVEIENCHVSNAQVTNQNKDITGGFVGYTEGVAEYDGLSGILGNIVELLSRLLNVVPGIGLGDLVSLLLEKDLTLGELIPTGYKKAVITDCSVSLGSGTIGNTNTQYNGGFVGIQTGTDINNCEVTGLTSVVAKSYAGGFAGLERNDTLNGALSKLKVEVTPDIQSTQVNCQAVSTENGLTIEAVENYAGGFNGCMADSTSSSCGVSTLTSVQAGKDYAGGFTGRATIGFALALGNPGENTTLVGAVGDLLQGVVEGDKGTEVDSNILNIIGIESSKIHDFSVAGNDIQISAGGSYVGGVLGSGDGVVLQNSSENQTDLKSVQAGADYAGGISGAVKAASGLGVLNEALGLAQALEFQIDGVKVDVEEVTAQNYYSGGAFGLLAGGTVSNSSVSGLKKTEAENYAGGFAGTTGATSVAEAGGINLLGLNLIEVNDLLSLGKILQAKVENCSLQGENASVTAIGNTEGNHYYAGGFVGENNSGKISDSYVTGLAQVSTTKADRDTYAGGFAGCSRVGGLADIGTDDSLGGFLDEGLLDIDGLLDAVGYLIPEYERCSVVFAAHEDKTKPQVKAASAGGFIGEMQGGKIDNSGMDSSYAVENVKYVEGTLYAGGFAGSILSGGLAQSDGLSVLGTNIDLAGLLSVLETYIPQVSNAGVNAFAADDEENTGEGLKVWALTRLETDVDSGTAGGYVGKALGARINDSNVNGLQTKTEEKLTEDDYAVKAPVYAGGFAGKADIGSAAAVGEQLNLLGIVKLGNLTSAVDAVESEFNSCDVYGQPGGFNVYAESGSAGGYVGILKGSRFNDCDSYNFEYIEGETSAGGYAGTMEPGTVANLVESTEVLGGLLSAGDLLSLAKTFIPRVWNSETTAVPCGGYVISSGESSDGVLKGLAGGYVGYNLGGQIIGNETEKSGGTGQKTASAIRIRSVTGQEYAGGFTGLMEAANIADTGSLEILWGTVKANNLISAVEAVYPTETNTQVTGPLRGMELENWNSWVSHVGQYGAYGDNFEKEFATQGELDNFIEGYIYGYTVQALAKDSGTGVDDGGSAGGYVGRMRGGVVTNANAQDVKSVNAYRSAGGFVGEMITGTVANAGGLELADLKIVDNLGVVSTFVPVIYSSQVSGYQSGMTVEAEADTNNMAYGNAGGFAGYIAGGQIWEQQQQADNAEQEAVAAKVSNLKAVTSQKFAGGFAGVMESGSALELDVQSDSGLLNQILGLIITSKDVDALAEVLNATLPTVGSAVVDGQRLAVDGGSGANAEAAGGFVGKAKGAVIGQRDGQSSVAVNNLKSVSGGLYAGGFFGLADVAGVAEVANENTSILGIIGLSNVNVLSSFRTYVYYGQVNGAEDGGFSVAARREEIPTDAKDDSYKNGNAGGFGGSLLDSTVLHSQVKGLSAVKGKNYTGGFVGLTGKSGVIDLDSLTVFEDLLGASAGVIDVFGSQIESSTLEGIASGYTVSSEGGQENIAGGFVGYGDLARIDTCQASQAKQIYSQEIAGGFIGKTSFAYLADVGVESPLLLEPVLSVVNQLLKLLYMEDLANTNLIKVQLPEPFNQVLELKVLADGDTLSVTLLGLKISVALVKDNGDGSTDVAQIHIGDSYIEVPCHDDGNGNYVDEDNIKIGLIKANRTKVVSSSVKGIASGYDVFGGGAGNDKDGSGNNGYAGGFVGYNDEGLLENNQMLFADTIRGSSAKVGEFSGSSNLETVYDWNMLKDIEGQENYYYVYRQWDEDGLIYLYNKDEETKLSQITDSTQTAVGENGISYYVYPVQHMEYENMYKHKDVWEGAYQTNAANRFQSPVKVYVSDAQANLMLGIDTYENPSQTEKEEGGIQDPCDEEAKLTIQKIWMDGNNSEETRPDSVEITLKQNGEEYKPITMKTNMAGFDENIWTTTAEVPVYSQGENGELEKYQYTIEEEPIKSQDGDRTYATAYSQSDDGYTLYVINYLPSQLIEEDTIVIDFGLSVDIDVLSNDNIFQEGLNGELAGILVQKDGDSNFKEDLTGKVTDTLSPGFEQSGEGTYGTAEIPSNQGEDNTKEPVVRFTPNSMTMDSYQRIMYAVKLTGDQYVYGVVTVIPSTEIYYEDSYGAIHYTDGSYDKDKSEEELQALTADENWKQHGLWSVVTDSNHPESQVQDTDRPGEQQVQKDVENLYGNDSHYKDCATYSNGSTHYTRVSAVNTYNNGGTSPVASFKFRGTGFDLISLTSRETGAVYIQMFKGTDNTGEVVLSHIEDTYYGYTYDEATGEWTLDEEAKDTLYQVPILKAEDLDYGDYYVEITPMYSDRYDMYDDHYYDFYLDAIRVYDPADPDDTKYQVIEDVYNTDGENHPQFTELRDILLNTANVGGEIPNGAVFVDGNGSISDIKAYESFGPKNEVYLAPGQAISFYLWTNTIPDKVQLSSKLAIGTNSQLSIASAVQEGAENDWEYYKGKTWTIQSSYDSYYEFTDNCIWEEVTDGFKKYRTKYPIVIANTMDENEVNSENKGVLSLTNLQWTGRAEQDDPEEQPDKTKALRMARASVQAELPMLMASVSPENIAAAYFFINLDNQVNIKIQYQDTEGSVLEEEQISCPKEKSYDVSQIVEDKTFEGYTQKEIQGDALKGTGDQDKLILVIYEKQSQPPAVSEPDNSAEDTGDENIPGASGPEATNPGDNPEDTGADVTEPTDIPGTSGPAEPEDNPENTETAGTGPEKNPDNSEEKTTGQDNLGSAETEKTESKDDGKTSEVEEKGAEKSGDGINQQEQKPDTKSQKTGEKTGAKEEKAGQVRTGDETPIGLLVLMMAFAAGSVALAGRKKHKIKE